MVLVVLLQTGKGAEMGAAFGGSAQTMKCVANGDVFHGGVYSSNAMVLAAAEAVLDRIIADANDIYARLEDNVAYFADGLTTVLRNRQIAHCVQHVGAMLSVFFTTDHVGDKITIIVLKCSNYGIYVRTCYLCRIVTIYAINTVNYSCSTCKHVAN